VFSVLPQCADRDTKWNFSVDTFTSTKSTHWKNSNILATHPKVHNSILKVKFQGDLKTVVSSSPINEDEFFAFLNDFPISLVVIFSIFDRNILWYLFCKEKMWKESFHKSYMMGFK